MFKNYIRVFLRSLLRQKGYTFINITGLAIGLTCCILILLFIQVELSYDRFLDNADQIYRVVSKFGEAGTAGVDANTSYPIAPALKADFPDVLDAVRIRRAFVPVISYEGRIFREDNLFYADSSFLDFFSFRVVSGDKRTALRQPNSIVITEETARRYFGDQPAIGKTLIFDNSFELRVDAVISDLPANTHLELDILVPIQNIGKRSLDLWTTFTQNYTYIRLPKNYPPQDLEAKFPGFISKHAGDQIPPGYVFDLYLQRLTDIHLRSNLGNEIKANGNVVYVQLFSAIAFLILIIACINFMNLAVARSVNRAKEVSIRKVAGAHRRHLIGQFLGESILLSFFSFLLALFLIELLLPTFSELTNRKLDMGILTHPIFIVGLFMLVIITGVIAGSYPTVFLSRFQPVRAMQTTSSKRSLAARIRKALVIFQFSVSIVLIVSAAVVFNQMDYMMKKDLGFDKEQVVVIPIDRQAGRQAEAIKREFMKNSNVISTSASMLVPTQELWTWGIKRETRDEGFDMGTYMVDFDFLQTYGIEVIAGRNFSREMVTDSTESFLLNEAAVAKLGWATPEQALGKRLSWSNGRRTGRVIGVVKDFHAVSLHEKIEPVVFFIDSNYYCLSAKIRTEGIRNTLSHLRENLAMIAPHLPFEYFFVDEEFDRLHREDERLAKTFASFSFLAILIACLGLFGLAALNTEQRTKEIGVRKVLGASIFDIIALITKDFAKLIFWAVALAIPVAYYSMNDWLQGFAYQTDIGWVVFAIAGGLTLGIAILTISYQAIRAATANPVDSLKYE